MGRGNRTCGLITPYRVMTLEAAAGKNPVSHVGKLYNLIANQLATTIVAKVPHIINVECVIVSQIGHPVSDPKVVDVCLTYDQAKSKTVETFIAEIVKSEFERLPELRDEILNERISVY